jgi:hypothetical protein
VNCGNLLRGLTGGGRWEVEEERNLSLLNAGLSYDKTQLTKTHV